MEKQTIGWMFMLSGKNGIVRVKVNFDDRFKDDKFYCDNEKITIVSDGVILNKSELFAKYKVTTLEDLLFLLLKKDEFTFFKEFIGPFNGFYRNKETGVLIVWGNQTGDSAPFYYVGVDGNVVVSNKFNLVYEELKRNGMVYSFSDKAAYQLLSFGYMVDDSTFLKEVKRVRAGKYLFVSEKGMNIKEWHRFSYKVKIDMGMNEAIELIDQGFRKAVKRCFDKDTEYGYKYHLVDLSGGLDSRMTTWVAHDMGYRNIVNICYSQSTSLDCQYAKDVAHFLGNQFYVKYLDEASFVREVEEVTKKNFGMGYYAGITGGNQFLKFLNFRVLGLEHTGQLGDLIVGGGYLKSLREDTIDVNGIKYSNRVSCEDINVSGYEGHELMSLYLRGFQGALSTHYIRSNYTYAVSPFIDPEFIDICFSIPKCLRIYNRLYWTWINKKYPMAGKIQSTRKQRTRFFIFQKLMQLVQGGFRRGLHIIGSRHFSHNKRDMNPFEFWYATNPGIRNFVNTYYEEHIHLLDGYKKLQADSMMLFNQGRVIEKLQVLTILAARKIYA